MNDLEWPTIDSQKSCTKKELYVQQASRNMEERGKSPV